MNMKIKQDREKKPIYRTTLQTENELYEMVHDPYERKTAFAMSNSFGEMKFLVDEVEYDGELYRPLPASHQLVEKNVILFPYLAMPYESEEAILKEIQEFIHKYVDVSDVFEQIATYYVLFTWLYDKFNEVPYLRAIGDFGTGKSRLLQTVGVLCYKPIFTGGATTSSPIFRILNEVKGTLVLDEADFKFSDMTSEIVKILNTGYQKGTAVLRSEGKGTFEVKAYDVFGPKIVGTRETFTDKALESRFLVEEMGSSKLRPDIPRSLDESFYFEAQSIRNKLLMWRLKNYFRTITKYTEVIENIHPRLNQIVIPLLSIINDDTTRERLKQFIIKYNGELIAERGLSWESDIVFSILKLEYRMDLKEITVKQIADEVNREIDVADETLQARKVGWYLRAKLQLKPHRTRKGWTLSLKLNRKRLDMWRERFGITDADIRGEEMNEVNVVNDEKDAQSEQFIPV